MKESQQINESKKAIDEYPMLNKDFSEEKLQRLKEEQKALNIRQEQCFINSFNLAVLKKDIDSFIIADCISSALMEMLLNQFAYQETEDNRGYPFLFISGFNAEKNEAKFTFNFYKNQEFNEKSSNLWKQYKFVAFILKQDDRWIFCLYNLADNDGQIIDFSNTLQKHDSGENVTEIFKQVCADAGLESSKFTIIDKYIIKEYNDCGIYVMCYIWHFLQSKNTNLEFQFPEDKNEFKEKLTFLLLQLGKISGSFEKKRNSNLGIMRLHSKINMGESMNQEKGMNESGQQIKVQKSSLLKKLTLAPGKIEQMEEEEKDKRQRAVTEPSEKIFTSKQEVQGMLDGIRKKVKEEKQKKNEKEFDRFLSQVIKKKTKNENEQICLTQQECMDIFNKFEQNIIQELEKQEKQKQQEDYQKQQNQQYNMERFTFLLQQYYQQDPKLYKELLDEYNHRTHNQILESIGLNAKYIVSNPLIPGNFGTNSRDIVNLIDPPKPSEQSMPVHIQNCNSSINQDQNQQNKKPGNMKKNQQENMFVRSAKQLMENNKKKQEPQHNSQVYEKPNKLHEEDMHPPVKSAKHKSNKILDQVEHHKEIQAKILGVSLPKYDQNLLKYEGITTSKVINFLIAFLTYKLSHLSQEDLARKGLRILYFPTTFYEELTNKDTESSKVNFESVTNYTSKYKSKLGTIFEFFDKIAIPIQITEENNGQQALVVADLKAQSLTIQDKFVQRGEKISQNILVNNIGKQLCNEQTEMQKKYLNLSTWNYEHGQIHLPENIHITGIVLAKMLQGLSKGERVFGPWSDTDLNDLRASLIKVILKIGIHY